VTMGTRPVKSGAVRNIGNFIAITNLHDSLDLFCRPRKDHGTRYLCHDSLIPQATFISSGTASITLANRRIIRNILRTNNRFHYLVSFLRDSHHLPPNLA
jgi:hypothetical protein